ncbi:MAG: 3-hydroxyacyl-ACP dehydratase FabZ [Alphaproteobacteria bacterium]|nr:MAG: 3-hydroxyacyl-ACP dehydratase FabZ [Alphaproteobacteria bacterium]
MANSDLTLDITDIMGLIPHRYPILLVDKIQDIVPGKSATGIKNVTFNEHFFQGHFPGHPVMPGVLIIEALAQTAAAFTMHTLGGDAKNKVVYFMTINDAKFRRPVKPGDILHLKVTLEQQRGPVSRFSGVAEVNGKVVSQAKFSAMIADK